MIAEYWTKVLLLLFLVCNKQGKLFENGNACENGKWKLGYKQLFTKYKFLLFFLQQITAKN